MLQPRRIFFLCRQNNITSSVGLINEVNQRRTRLVLGWVTVIGRVNRPGMQAATDSQLGRLSLPSLRGR